MATLGNPDIKTQVALGRLGDHHSVQVTDFSMVMKAKQEMGENLSCGAFKAEACTLQQSPFPVPSVMCRMDVPPVSGWKKDAPALALTGHWNAKTEVQHMYTCENNSSWLNN